jgi:predicted ATP-dependent protease
VKGARPPSLTSVLGAMETTAEVTVPKDPFQRIIGQDNAVALVRSAVTQRRHVLLCGAPGVGKSLIAEAAYTLLPKPREEIRLRHDSLRPDRPRVVVIRVGDDHEQEEQANGASDCSYIRPEEMPFEVASRMGYRCPRCGSFSSPSQSTCVDCGSPKRCDWLGDGSYHGLFRALDVVGERALICVTCREKVNGAMHQVEYRRTGHDLIQVVRGLEHDNPASSAVSENDEHVLVSLTSPRFVRVTGANEVELLGDVKHDPYGSAESLGMPAYRRAVPGAIHEAHEGLLYIDEIGTLGPYQKHLLTAMQDRKYPITGHNPQSSGAAVRVDDVPCDFLLFASCNPEDLPSVLPPLRSRIRGYGYEIMLSSSMPKTPQNVEKTVQFVAQTVEQDGRIPHLTAGSVESILRISEEFAHKLDGQKEALTLRLRDLGGVIRIAGDLAVRDDENLILPEHVTQAEEVFNGVGGLGTQAVRPDGAKYVGEYGSYFF